MIDAVFLHRNKDIILYLEKKLSIGSPQMCIALWHSLQTINMIDIYLLNTKIKLYFNWFFPPFWTPHDIRKQIR